MAATGMEVGAVVGVGVPLSGLDLGSAMVGAGAIPTRTTRDHITTRRPIPRDRRAAGRGYAFGATGTGHTAGRGAAGKKKPAGQAGFLRLIQRSALIPFAHIDEMTGNRSRCRHCRRHEVRAALVTLTPFKIAVRRRCAALARLQLVGVHRKAHLAARLAPLETSGFENLVEAFRFRLHLHEAGAGDDLRVDVGIDRLAFDHARHSAQVLDTRIGA